ncbi:NAD-dependent deacetylase hst3 [Glugoides intestinalis]
MKDIDKAFIEHNKELFEHKKCVFVIGAGISVASGIPDFRSPTGIFASLKQQLKINGKNLFTYNFGIREGNRHIYLKCISTLKRLCEQAVPNRTHHFLANYPRSRVYTQNIDGLEEKAGMQFIKKDTTKGVYLHGNLSLLICQYCGFKKLFTEEDVVIFEEGKEICCTECAERRESCVASGIRKRPQGLMHPGIIHYQQAHPDGAFIGKMCEKDLDCDMLVVIGTSLAVEGVKKIVKMFCRNHRNEGKRFLVNLTRPNKEWNDYFDYFFEGDCEEFVKTLETFSKMPKYNENSQNISNIHNDVSRLEFIEVNKREINIFPGLLKTSVPKINEKVEVTTMDEREEVTKTDVCQHVTKTDVCQHVTKTDVCQHVTTMEEKLEIATLEEKLEKLTKSFSDEETIGLPVLETALKQTNDAEVQSSFCVDLQEEIDSIVSKSIHEDDAGP